jgi:hypothetical protein
VGILGALENLKSTTSKNGILRVLCPGKNLKIVMFIKPFKHKI